MRYIPSTPSDRAEMLREIGVSSLDDLLASIPSSARLKRPLDLPAGKSEWEVRNIMSRLARSNRNTSDMVSFLGAGSYDHFVPSAVTAVAGRSEFLTAYTPYQPEVSQGTLQVIYEFQSMICELFAMDAANASVYDGGSALAEAVLLARAQTRRTIILWPETVHPHYRQVAETIATPSGTRFQELATECGKVSLDALRNALTSEVCAVVFQYPNFFGLIEELREHCQVAHDAGALVIVVADPLAMGVLDPPGRWGADIVVGEGQGLGNPQSYGGPYLGLFAVREKLVRRMPGRIVGTTVDVTGQRGYVLTLQTREQHIRRDKATSNICTNEGLCATRAAIYMSLLGPQGLRDVGETCLRGAHYLLSKLLTISGVTAPFSGPFFKEFAVRLNKNIPEYLKFMSNRGFLAGIPLARFHMGHDDLLLVSVTENRTREELDQYASATSEFMGGANS